MPTFRYEERSCCKILFRGKNTRHFIYLIFFTAILSCSISDDIPEGAPTIPEMIENGAKVYDVRTLSEWEEGHYEHAIHIPVSEVSRRISEFGDKEDVIIVHCAVGVRSGRAKTILKDAGYKNVFNVGGLSDLLQALEK